jgi:hypothetical protein
MYLDTHLSLLLYVLCDTGTALHSLLLQGIFSPHQLLVKELHPHRVCFILRPRVDSLPTRFNLLQPLVVELHHRDLPCSSLHHRELQPVRLVGPR